MTMARPRARCLEALDAAGRRPGGGLRAVDGRLRRLRAAGGARRSGSRAWCSRTRGPGPTRRGRRRPPRRWPSGCERGQRFLVESPPPLLSGSPRARAAATGAATDRRPAGGGDRRGRARGWRSGRTPPRDLAGIDVPTLVVTSDGDTLIPAEVTAPMAEQIPGAGSPRSRAPGTCRTSRRPTRSTAARAPRALAACRADAGAPRPALDCVVTTPAAFAARTRSRWTSSRSTAIDALDAGRSVLVAAPTGPGKTVVAEFAIERALDAGGKASTRPR